MEVFLNKKNSKTRVINLTRFNKLGKYNNMITKKNN